MKKEIGINFNENFDITKTQFGKDFDKPMNINGSKQTLGWYNLIVTIPHLRFFIETGKSLDTNFKIKNIKNYFGLNNLGYNKVDLLICLENFKFQLEKYNKNLKNN